jgi:penicillin amidase
MVIDLRKWAAGAAATALAALGAVYLTLSASLPRQSDAADLPGASAPVTIELDERAIPRIRAASLEDALRAQGFVHAQQRFFQMDLARRAAAGELAALFGERALPLDRARRVFQFRARARALAAALPARHRAWLSAYAGGVNAGLADLGARPPEYWIAGAEPEPWMIEDSVLVVYGLYTMLSNNEAYERGQAVMRAVLPASVYQFLTPTTTRFDRPIVHDLADPTGGYAPAPLPPAEDLVRVRRQLAPTTAPRIDPPLLGPASNQWSIAPERSVRGVALVGNDPHLTLRLPNTFYRSELYWRDRAVRGVSIAGLPGILLGASDALAWGATVSNADQSDWVVIEVDPADSGRYLVPEGTEAFGVATESIAVRGREPESVAIRTTRWGPVVERDWQDRPLALHAAWLVPDGLDLGLLDLMLAQDVNEAAEVLARWSGPSLNWTLAGTDGAIAWALNGPLPRRLGFDGSRAESWADGTRAWRGEHTPPSVRTPPGGVLFTANHRTLPARDAIELSRMWMPALRAKRIDDLLAQQPAIDERASLAMQLDTRAEAFDSIRDIVLEVVAERDADPRLAAARARVAGWGGHAAADDVGFRLLHAYYRALVAELLAPLVAPAARADPRFVYRWPLADEPLRRLLEERPPELLPDQRADWRSWLRAILAATLARLAAEPGGVGAPWGEANALDVEHPLAALPLLGRWLRLPRVPQPGAFVTLRVAAPDYGAQFRMSVAPAEPERGILQMSGGQSGHFLSPHFIDQQPEWVAGTPAPFLAGPTVHRFTLK